MLEVSSSPGGAVLLAAVSSDDAIPLAAAGALSLVAWLALAAVVLAATRPKLPPAGPATIELGPEPPAVANLLAHRCHVTATAVSATLLDLAARRHLAIDQVAPDTYLCRLHAHRSGTGQLTPYEAKVLDLVRAKATKEGTVAIRELSLGRAELADSWWKSFAKLVVDDARHRGLVRRRWGRLPALLLSATLVIPLVFGGAAVEVLGAVARAGGSTAESDEAGSGLVMAGFLWVAVVVLGAAKLRAWRETDAGRTAAAHWLGVREHVRSTDLLISAPPAAVAVWDRHLAYGVALGACPAAAQAVPIGPQRDDEAWSAYGGLWREVAIEYPRRSYEGEAPVKATLLGVGWSALAGLVGFVLVRAAGPMLFDIIDTVVTESGPAWLGLVVFVGVAFGLGVPFIWCGAKLAKGLVTLARAVPDLASTPVSFEGQVLRVPWGWKSVGDSRRWEPTGFTAVDDGRRDEVRALRFYRPDVAEGSVVRVTITPRMRHVTSCEVLAEATAARRWQAPRPTSPVD